MLMENSLQDLPHEGDLIPKTINYNPEPVVIDTKEALIAHISAYFDYCNTFHESPTFTGLALNLGMNRTTLRHYPQNNPKHEFSPIIEKALNYIVDYAEKQLFQPKSAAGVQFWLKNNDDWQDKHDISVSKAPTMMDILEDIQAKNTPLKKTEDQDPYDQFFSSDTPTPPGQVLEDEQPVQNSEHPRGEDSV